MPMYSILKVGEAVTFPGLLDIKLIVDEVFENRGNARCKYYDDHLKKFIKLTLPIDALAPIRKTLKARVSVSNK
jgi:hypothetical protein